MKTKLLRNLVVLLVGVALVTMSGCTDTSSPDEVSEDTMLEESPDSMADTEEDAAMEENMTETMGESGSVIDPADFTNPVANPYFPLEVGTTFILEGESDGEDIRVEIYVTDQTKEIMGVTTMVIRDREWEDGELVEDTYDWFANDNEGNVWYFGEDSKEYDEGELVGTSGSWEGGVDGAEPGILMKANPQVGDIYQQEYYEGEAEDMAEVLSLDASVTVEYGSFDNCLQTKEWTPLEPGVEEHKYYASGIGILKEEAVVGGDEVLELVEITIE
ncbi:hypothetical protein RE474_06060 [Methanolobus sediminis]|uniref:Uncharacterized protein n=1 Tax=Methanolobus sediminis TaxID=3072978 RepID=A0AA51UMF4_9EURY|nr:hypothetical protein [Methanolobus sediminis]WMW26274.1 hypothetical protein RE474_06060 [Methanolobus sediminis]